MAWNPNVPTVTNRVQDDLAAMRENFQHLDQLAERVDELQTVSGLAPYVQEILDGRIVEMGTNSNGTYVRWENGLQVCYHRLNIGTPNGVQTFSWTYPAAFASSDDAYPMGIVAVSSNATNVFGRYVKIAVARPSVALPTQTTFFVQFNETAAAVIYLHAFATGRWK